LGRKQGVNGSPVRGRLLRIPPGTSRRYGDLARDLGTSARAVGNACRANPLPNVIPCHRVVGATGLGSYAGATAGQALAAKTWLLPHEACSAGG
jgi:methylated-DNA-[protein]-cysteine S-methyltransferase